MSIKIAGTGIGIPKRSVTNDELAQIVETSDEWISSRTGIKSRRVCTDESLTDLCETAALQALERAGTPVEDIDLIICSTIGGDFTTPSLACALQERINGKCPAFDINVACSGFIYALDIASLYISSGKTRNILIVCAEQMSRHLDWSDRTTCILFGDGAGAAVVTAGNALKYINLESHGNTAVLNLPVGSGTSPFMPKKEPGYLYMDGGEVFKYAVSSTMAAVSAASDAMGMKADDFDMFVLHQANKRIIDSVRTRLKLSEEKFPMNISEYGNMSSVAIPVLLHELLLKDAIKPGDKLFLSAFGAGLADGACVMVWE